MTDSDARNAILERIRSSIGDSERAAVTADSARIARTFRQGSPASREEIVSLFEERLSDYGATVDRVGETEVAALIRRILAERGNPRMVVPPGLPTTWIPEGVNLEVDHNFSPRQLDGFEGVLTGASLGIAETGTVVLQGGAGQGRRALTLVPDFHLCALRSNDVIATVPEAIARLAPTAYQPTTFISGPSATADIEMTRIKGVHGPRSLHIILVDQVSEESFDIRRGVMHSL